MAILVILIPLIAFVAIGLIATLLFGWVIPALGGDPNAWYGVVLKTAFILLGFVLPLSSVLTWMERRQSAMMQDRVGPNRARIGNVRAFGLLHFLADALKMLFKEDFVPAKANKLLFALAPVLAIAPVLIVFAIVPWGGGVCPGQLRASISDEALQQCLESGGARFQVVHLEVGLLFYFAIASLAVYGTTLAGWASYNKWSLLGGLRASSQMMSYEVTMGMAILGAFIVYGSLEPSAIVEAQGQGVLHWGIVTQPLGFLLFFTAAVAETKRAPFDLPEGEPEVIGYFVEYSGMRFGMFFLAEFMEVVFTSAIVVTVFFGGWQLPGLHADGFSWWQMPHWVVATLWFVTFAFKVFVFCWFQLMIRWTLPRFRPDQLMRLGWKQLLPASIANILVTAGVVLALQAGALMAIGVKTVHRPQSAAQQAYVPAVLTGLGVTMRHFFANLIQRKHIVTVQYPEEKVAYPPRNRGLHRLMVRDDGAVRCVACMCCPTACPAHCITIVAEDTGNPAEKRPLIFEIDELRCVVCGLCVEACPCDAIRMDTGTHAAPVGQRGDAVLGKIDLMKLGAQSTATQGGKGGGWREQQPPSYQPIKDTP